MPFFNESIERIFQKLSHHLRAFLSNEKYFFDIPIVKKGNRRTASVRSVGYSDLFVLSKKDMWDVLKEYPAARVRLEAIAVKRLEKYKKAPLEKGKRKLPQ
jgi:cyclic nucleotide gated channel alpha 3